MEGDNIMNNNIEKNEVPVTSDIPMLNDETVYKIYIILKNSQHNHNEIKAVAKICGINYIEAQNRLKETRNLIVEGDAYKIWNILQKLYEYDVSFEVSPPYPYKSL